MSASRPIWPFWKHPFSFFKESNSILLLKPRITASSGNVQQSIVDLTKRISTAVACNSLSSKMWMWSKDSKSRRKTCSTNFKRCFSSYIPHLCCIIAVALQGVLGGFLFHLRTIISLQIRLRKDNWCCLSTPLFTCGLLYSQPAVMEVVNKTFFLQRHKHCPVCDYTGNISMAFSCLPKASTKLCFVHVLLEHPRIRWVLLNYPLSMWIDMIQV